MSTKDLVNAIIVGDAVEIENAFQATMAEKISSRLDDYRQEVAQSMFKTEEAELEEAFDPHKKAHPNGGVVGTAVDYFNKNAEGKPRLTVFLKPNRDPNKIQRGRMKTYDISHHYDEKEADQAKKDYAKKFGYHAMTKLGEEVELDEATEGEMKNRERMAQRADAERLAHGAMSRDEYNKKWKKGPYAQPSQRKRLPEELELDEEQLDELSKGTLGSYIKKAGQHRVRLAGKERDLEDKANAISTAKHNSDDDTYKALSQAQKNVDDQKWKVRDKSDKRAEGIGRAVKRLTKEEVEQILASEEFAQLDELSKTTLGNYIKKASGGVKGAMSHAYVAGGGTGASEEGKKKSFDTAQKRLKGIRTAVDKLTKEDVEQLVVTTVESALYAMQDGRNVLDEQMDEAVSSSSKDNYEWTHGNKPKGHGNWYFSTVHPRQHDFDKHKDQTVNVTGTFGDAAKKAQAHFKEKGHKGEIHVLT